VEAVLVIIPTAQPRDRLLFRLIFETGLRISETSGLHLEDPDLTADDEHLNVLGKGGQRRTAPLDDARLVGQLRAYLKHTGQESSDYIAVCRAVGCHCRCGSAGLGAGSSTDPDEPSQAVGVAVDRNIAAAWLALAS
jgi:integrase